MTLSPTRTKTSDAKLCQLQCHGEIGEILNHEGKQGCIANRGISEFPEGSVSTSWKKSHQPHVTASWKKVTSTGQKSHQNIKIPMAHRLSRNVVISPKMKKTLRTLRYSHMFKLCFQRIYLGITMAHGLPDL